VGIGGGWRRPVPHWGNHHRHHRHRPAVTSPLSPRSALGVDSVERSCGATSVGLYPPHHAGANREQADGEREVEGG
jgi:hypothetical protein